MSHVAGAVAPPTPSVLLNMCRMDNVDLLLPHDDEMMIIPAQAGGNVEQLPLQPVILPHQAGGNVVPTVEQILRNEIQSMHHTLAGTRTHAEKCGKQRKNTLV